MSAINQEPLDTVLKNYEIKVLDIRNESYKDKKGVWWIQTPNGYNILKKVSCSEETLKYILQAVAHLVHNGTVIPGIVRTRDGREYTLLDGSCYVLSEAVSGKNPSYDSPPELMRIVKELARFHKSSIGFSPSMDCKPKYHLGTWPEDYEQQIEDMNSFYKDEAFISQNEAIGKIIIKEFPYFYRRAKKALEGLRGREYAEWVEKTKLSGSLCHQDFAAGNLILEPQGRLVVIDTDSITFDIPARDIRKLLNKIMKKKGSWDTELTEKILEYYQKENPLSRPEWTVVKLDLMFPHLFIGAMNKYCYRRDKEWDSEKYLQRIKEMSTFEKTIEPVLNGFEKIIPG